MLTSHTKNRSSFQLPIVRMVAAAALVASFSAAYGQNVPDDSVWINSGINAALKAGKMSYILPPGTLNLAKSIIIPRGAKYFTLQGAANGGTILKTPGVALPEVVTIGGVSNLAGSNQLTAEDTAFVKPVKTGDTRIYLTGTTPTKMPTLKVGMFLVLRDKSIVAHCLNGGQQPNHDELVKVVGFDLARGTVDIDVPAAREYDSTARLSDVTSITCEGITVKGLSFDGAAANGRFSDSMISVGVADKVALNDIKIKSFGTRAISTVLSRNVGMANISVADGANPQTPGGGYGITISLSRFVTVKDSIVLNTRHAFVSTNGATDINFVRCTASGGGNFDTHGFDERRITYTWCDGDGGFAAGNGGWLGGGSDILYDHCSSTVGAVCIGPNVNGLKAVSCDFTNIIFDSRKSSPMGIPSMGFADNIVFTRCSIVGQRSAIDAIDDDNFGDVMFDNCYIETDNSPLSMLDLEGTMHFKSSTIVTRAPYSSKLPVFANRSVANPNAAGLNLDFDGSRIFHASAGEIAVVLAPNYVGTAKFKNCTFDSLGGKVVNFLRNESKMTPSIVNCVARGVKLLSIGDNGWGKDPQSAP